MIQVPVYKGRRAGGSIIAYALIDDSDVFLTRYRWRLHSDGYVYRYDQSLASKKTRYLHRVVLWYEGELEVSHKNGNPLDNRSENLEVVSYSLNKLNPNDRTRGVSAFRGVARDGNVVLQKPWRGKVKVNGKLYCTKRFRTELEAARALNEIRESLGIPIDMRVYGPLPTEYGNPRARIRSRFAPAKVKPL